MLILKLSTICYWIYELKSSKLLYRVILAVTFSRLDACSQEKFLETKGNCVNFILNWILEGIL